MQDLRPHPKQTYIRTHVKTLAQALKKAKKHKHRDFSQTRTTVYKDMTGIEPEWDRVQRLRAEGSDLMKGINCIAARLANGSVVQGKLHGSGKDLSGSRRSTTIAGY